MKARLAAAWLTLWVIAAPAAAAEWLEVSGDHFVIYSDQKEKTVRQFAEPPVKSRQVRGRSS